MARVGLHCTEQYEVGHLRIVRLLVESGAEVDAWSDDDETAFDVASGNGKPEVARSLRYREARENRIFKIPWRWITEVDTVPRNAAFPDAAESNPSSEEDVTEEVTVREKFRYISHGKRGILPQLQTLLDGGAKVNQRDAVHKTPLDCASSSIGSHLRLARSDHHQFLRLARARVRCNRK